MARSRNKRRDTSAIANRRLPLSHLRVSASPSRRRSDFIRSVEDRRFWNPEPLFASARSFSTPRHRLKLFSPLARRELPVSSSKPPVLSNRIGFVAPKELSICVRRKQREEVLHALHKTGRRGQKRPKFSVFSKTVCK